MNHAFIRPGGVAQDLPPGALDEIRDFVALMKKRLPEYAALCNANPIFRRRLEGVGQLNLEGCMALGITGPVLRSTGYAWDLRKSEPYSGYQDYDFRSEEHTSELQSLMRISYAVFCLKKNNNITN